MLEQTLKNGVAVEVPFVFKRPRVLELIEAERITILPAVPYIFDTLAETPRDTQANLSSLRLCFSAGNFLSQEVFEKFLQRFKIPVRQLYGCTEAGSVSINLDPHLEDSYDSIGVPLENVEITIVDEEGNQLPNGKMGEVVIKSKALTKGYHNLPEVNQEAFKNDAFFTGRSGQN